MTQVPISLELGRAVAMTEAIGRPELFGRGVLDDPLFPVEVQLTGEDGNCYAVTGRVEAAVRTYLRRHQLEKRFRRDIEHALRRELWSSSSYGDLMVRAACLVRAL